MFKGLGVVCALWLFLTGCGATGGSNSVGGGAISYVGKAEGIYLGTTSNANLFEGIVLPNDQFYEIYGTLAGNPYSVSGMIVGQGVSGNGTYTASVTNISSTGQTSLQTIVASFATGASIGGILTNVGSVSGVSFTGSALPGSYFNFDARASLGDISGNWTGTLLDGTSTTVTVNSSGVLNGSASGCLFSGTAVADPSNNNFFDVSLAFGGAPCVFANQTESGIAVECLLPDGVTHQFVVAVTQGFSTGTVFFAQRSGNGGGGSLGALNGQYAFSLSGFDSTGNPMSMAGSIKADGLGHVTAGEVDLNDNGVFSSNNLLSGTYAFDSNVPLTGGYVFNGNAQGTLGTIALTYTVGAVSHPLAFAFSLQASGGFGQIMSLDTKNFIASGTVQQQNSSTFALSNLAGDYTVAFRGSALTNPTSTLGRLTLGSGGVSTNVTFDRSIAGVGASGPTTGASVSVAFGSAGPDANGRGTFTLTLNDTLANTTQSFAYYAISAKRIIAIETDGNGTMTGDFSRQSTPFAAATVLTGGSVFGMTGVDTAASNGIAAVGQLQITGNGTNTGTLRWDSNDAGSIVGPAVFMSQAVPSFDTTTGRGTVTIANGFVNGLADSLVFYLTAPGTGFIMDTTTGVFNRAMVGTLAAQAGGPYSAFADLGGLGIVRSKGLSVSNALSFVGLFGLTTTPGTYALIFDQRFPTNGIVQTLMDQSAPPGVMVQALDNITGRGTLLLPSGSKTATKAFYVVGPNQFVFIDISPASSGLNGPSNLFFVDAR